MKFRNHVVSLSCSIVSCLIASQSAQAGVLIDNWNYASDPSYDSLAYDRSANNGLGGIVAGNTIFEIYGMGIKEDGDQIWVGINTNLPLTGLETGLQHGPESDPFDISNGNIGHGDLFFDFSGLGSFKAASDSASLFAVRFAPNNDSNAPTIGVFDQVKATSVITQNAGWSNLGNHNLNGVLPLTGQPAAMGDLAWNDPYYHPYTEPGEWSRPETLIPNVIASGNKIGDITLLSGDELVAAGFNSSVFPASGRQLFGFKFDKNLLPIGNYIASWIEECMNEGIAIVGRSTPSEPEEENPVASVPEPGTNTAIMLFGFLGFCWQLKRRKLKKIS